MAFRGVSAKIALLEKYDTKLQCGQCHVEYNCNPGYDPKTGEDSIRLRRPANEPLPVQELPADLRSLQRARVPRLQAHPDRRAAVESAAPGGRDVLRSKHAQGGRRAATTATCRRCATRKGKVYTSHLQTSPRNHLKRRAYVEMPPCPYGGAGRATRSTPSGTSPRGRCARRSSGSRP